MARKRQRPCGTDGTHLPRTEAAVAAYRETGEETDPLGMWTGHPHPDVATERKVPEVPVQDADDL